MFGLHEVSYSNMDSGLQDLTFDLPYTSGPNPQISGGPIEYMGTLKGYFCTNSEENSSYLVPMYIDPALGSPALDSKVPALLGSLDGIEDHAASSSFSNYGTDKVARTMNQKELSSSKSRREHNLYLHRAAYRSESQRYNHIMAERQRREEMNEKFSILRTILPNITKKDKASIVTDTINYVRELEKKVKYLQDFKYKANKTKGSKQNHSSTDHEIKQDELVDAKMMNDEYKQDLGALPHIELKNMGNQALIKLVCSRSRGLILRTHKALVDCKVDLLQSKVTTLENNAVHCFSVELNPGVSASNDEIISALEEATRNGHRSSATALYF
ncbi:hypothetical protein SUGI_1190240 [Cryptomeria japonica]|nr:hypothetical protein SUGI_1190240 [Cryptomeria japonica]